MKNQKLENILTGFIKLGAYFTLLTPLIISQNFFYAFIVPKTIFFRIIVGLMLITYLVLIVNFPKYRPKFNALTISLTVFILISIISSIFGINFSKSFWSVYERETGLLTLLHLYSFFIILSSVFKKETDWKKFLIASIIVAIIACFLVVTSMNSKTMKGGGTIGNTSFLGTYLLFNMFFAVIFLMKEKLSGLGIFSLVVLSIMFPVVLTAKARAATVSFLGGLFLVFIGSLFFSEEKKKKFIAIGLVIGLIIFSLALYFYVPKVQNFVNGHLESMKARYLVWEAAWKGFLEKPFLGWGLENFNVVFIKYFDSRLFLKEFGGEVWFDRSHNIILDTLVTTGSLGLLSYLSIFFVAVYYLFKKIIKKEKVKTSLSLIALLAAYFVQNMTVFDIISSYMTLFLTLAFINFLWEENREEVTKEKPIQNKLVKNISYLLILIVGGSLIYFGGVQAARGSQQTLLSIVGKSPEKKLEAYKKTLEIPRYNTETNRYFANELISQSLRKDPNKEVLSEAVLLVEEAIKQDIEENELDYRSYLSLGRAYVADFKLTGKKEKLDKAEKVLNEAINLSPKNQNAYWLLSDVKFQKGEKEKSIELVRKTIELEPRLYNSYWYLISSYMMSNQNSEALSVIEEAKEKGVDWTKKLDNAKKILSIYEENGKIEKALSFSEKILDSYPQEAKIWLRKGIYLYKLNNQTSAQEAFNQALKINPKLESQIKEIKNLLN